MSYYAAIKKLRSSEMRYHTNERGCLQFSDAARGLLQALHPTNFARRHKDAGGRGRALTPDFPAVSNFSRTVLSTFKCHGPRNHRSVIAFPRSSASPTYLSPFQGCRRRVLGDGGRGSGEDRKGQYKLRGTRRGLGAGIQRPLGLRTRREEGWTWAGKGREESGGAAGVAALTLRSQLPRAAAGSP